jgi:hypothetical protein
MEERRIIGWRVQVSEKRWIFFADLRRADSFAQERNATLQECYSDGSVQTIRFGDEQAA